MRRLYVVLIIWEVFAMMTAGVAAGREEEDPIIKAVSALRSDQYEERHRGTETLKEMLSRAAQEQKDEVLQKLFTRLLELTEKEKDLEVKARLGSFREMCW